MKATTSRTANFGPYTLDLRSGEMRKFGTKIKMGEQSFRILCMLLETPGEMVTREELRAKLWADDTFVDFDHGLNSAVQRLRDCLSDSAGKPLWVETLHRAADIVLLAKCGGRMAGSTTCPISTA